MNRKDLLIRAIETWGKEAQQLMAIEECSELIKALCKIPRGGLTVAVIDEIADVQIMLNQLKLIYGEAAVVTIENAKLERLEGRLDKQVARRVQLTREDLLFEDHNSIFYDGGGVVSLYLYSTDALFARIGMPSYEEQAASDEFDEDHDVNFYAVYNANTDAVFIDCSVYGEESPIVSLSDDEKVLLRALMQKRCIKETGESLHSFAKADEEDEEGM